MSGKTHAHGKKPGETGHRHGKDSKEKEIAELKETLQRVQAEFENSCKRIEKQKQEFIEFANAQTIKELLPLLDSFEAAIGKIEKQESAGKAEALEGLGLLQRQLLGVMQRHGLEEIKSQGEKCNPLVHEAMLQANDSGKEDEEILEELQKGYLLKGKVLRPAKVKVNKIGENKINGEN